MIRIEAALQVNGGRLFRGRDEMKAAFELLTRRFPQFSERTESILREWDAEVRPKVVRDAVEGTWPLSTAAQIYRLPEDLLCRWIDEADDTSAE